VTGERRKLRSEELHDLCCVSDIIWVLRSRRVRWAVHVALTRGKRRAYRCLVGKPEGKVPHRGRRPTCEDNTKMDLKTGEIGGRGMDLCGSEQAKVTANLAEFLCSPLGHGMSRQMFSFGWYKVTGKPRGTPNCAVICFKNACVVQRYVK